MSGKSHLDALAGLINNGETLSDEQIAQIDEQDAAVVAEINAVLKFVSRRPGVEANIFAMQELVEACAEELRNQIREMVEGDDER